MSFDSMVCSYHLAVQGTALQHLWRHSLISDPMKYEAVLHKTKIIINNRKQTVCTLVRVGGGSMVLPGGRWGRSPRATCHDHSPMSPSPVI